ncbi:MAG: ABC-F family ATP-binding cassette domain-containing protein, partial [Acidobacteria bacterium]|nr:ABC-F family ATP-binding cassette domain-containing protein [Acidobacteriota bacterium]
MAVLLVCDAVSKSFSARPLFQDISLTISDTERLGLIGPNGSGKTTLMRILAGDEPPDSGSVSVRKLTKAGYVAQEPVFPWDKSVLQILEEAAPADAEAMDLLLLDEPTNHLDLEGILWLEKLLASSAFACVVVSHDRYFLENVATRMAEINRLYPAGLLAVDGNYSRFLEKKDEFLLAQAKQQEALETRVRREIEWLRRGAKARTSKSKARIDEAGRLISELDSINSRSASGTAQIDFTATDRRTKRLIWTEKISKSLGGRTLFENLSFTLGPGMRLGLVGPNGSGKSTLLRLLMGEIEPGSGTVERADNLRVVYFDQEREQLDMNVTLRRALAPEGDLVQYRGRPTHVAGWAKRFLFNADQLDLAVQRLSGGEQARVLIARLMLQPADILLLDEPTNDLDIPTLEVLEESLLDFPGSLVLVTHDRYLLDRVSNAVLGLDGEGEAAIFADYSQWEQSQVERRQARAAASRTVTAAAVERAGSAGAKKKLSYLEQREWEQ